MAEKVLVIDNISKRFGGLQATNAVSFHVNKGEILGIIGPNGAGKSTLFNLITGFYPIDSGTITYKGQRIDGMTPDRICHQGITRTFQVARPFGGLTVFDNILVASLSKAEKVSDARAKVNEVLKIVSLDNKADSLGADLTTLERKRLELGKALATDPEILLLDEVMTGLKPKEMDAMMDLIRELKKTKTIVIVEHVMRVIMNISDRIIVLDHGQLIAEGLPKEIAENPTVIEAYLGRGAKHA